MKVVAVFDRKTQIYWAPMFVPHEELAIREFQAMAENENNRLSQHPSDFELHCLGEAVLQGRCKIELFDHPELLVNAGEHMRGRIEELGRRLSDLKKMSEEEFARLLEKSRSKQVQ